MAVFISVQTVAVYIAFMVIALGIFHTLSKTKERVKNRVKR